MKTKIIIFLTCFFSIISIVASPALLVSASTEYYSFELIDDIVVKDITFDIQRNVSNVSSIDIVDFSYNSDFVFSVSPFSKGVMLYLTVDPTTNSNNQFLFNCNFDFLNGSPTNSIANSLSFDVFIMKPPSDMMWCTAYRNNENNTSLVDIKSISNESVGAWGSYNQLPSDKGKGINVKDITLEQSYDDISSWQGYHIDYGFTSFKPYGSYGFTIGMDCLRSTSFVRIFLTNFKYSYGTAAYYAALQIISNQDENTDKIISNQNENTDKIINAGEDVDQPDFDNTNDSLDNTTKQMQSIEGEYKLDKTSTQKSLNEGKNFIMGTDMQKASVQVKNWIEKFGSDNVVISGFLVACMVLGVCFWVIGRKSW